MTTLIPQRLNAAYSALTARGGPWNFTKAKPFADELDLRAERLLSGRDTSPAGFELALHRWVDALGGSHKITYHDEETDG